MASMNISIRKEAYDFLTSLKGKDQSFSDVILSFRKEPDIMRFHGALKDKDWTTARNAMKDFRDELDAL
ncbi:hypothetical protein COV94_02940 [Candidatus Woesearchaeota archaeon CG11_big_fil_rev_8_21_14_0_20_57_5]|nr:MAG: hypothetical protein COV94_02940 [Candidatus Woesearchaeota archaeon CG11_big_fil_rev_8_21_14_0_20_57_5]